MRNPVSIIFLVMGIAFLMSGKLALLVPAIIFFVIFNSSQNKNRSKRRGSNPRGTQGNYDPYRREREREARRRNYEQRQRKKSSQPKTLDSEAGLSFVRGIAPNGSITSKYDFCFREASLPG